MGQAATEGYFSSDYQEARDKFLQACSAAGARVESFKNPRRGPEGETLFTDVALLGTADAETVLVLGSGTHGVEGFAGSGIQVGLLREGVGSNLKPNVRIVMIHAINPYGFAHLRRFNEENIDLNRNFLEHAGSYPANYGYEELRYEISPRNISRWAEAKSYAKLFLYRLRKGEAALRRAVNGGQYSHPQGLFFGGRSEAWSNTMLRKIAIRYLSDAKKVVFVDFHTGLGSFGDAEIILNVSEESPAFLRATKWWGDKSRSTASGESVSIHLAGTLKLAFPDMIPGVEVTAVSLEFGTVSSRKVFSALRAENWLHHYGGNDKSRAKDIKEDLLRAFYPDDDEWKHKVWRQGREAVDEVLNFLQGGR
ncbi:M14 family metallopeptidase [bacterium]|nr:M14 family metallopeptidase [bacterium]